MSYIFARDGAHPGQRSSRSFPRIGNSLSHIVISAPVTRAFISKDRAAIAAPVSAPDGKNHVYSDEAFEKTVMKVGDEDSNIERLRVNEDGYLTVDLIDEEKDWVAIEYVCDRYNEAVLSLNDTVLFTELDADNAKIMQFAMLMAVPVLIGSCLVFMVVLPMCLGEGQSLGKKSIELCARPFDS